MENVILTLTKGKTTYVVTVYVSKIEQGEARFELVNKTDKSAQPVYGRTVVRFNEDKNPVINLAYILSYLNKAMADQDAEIEDEDYEDNYDDDDEDTSYGLPEGVDADDAKAEILKNKTFEPTTDDVNF